MLTREELVSALVTNLDGWDWDIYSKFPVDMDTGRALVKVYKGMKSELNTLRNFVNDMGFGSEPAKNKMLVEMKNLQIKVEELEKHVKELEHESV